MNEFDARRRQVISEVEEAHSQGRKLLYLDELNFTKLSFLTKDWSVKKTNVSVD